MYLMRPAQSCPCVLTGQFVPTPARRGSGGDVREVGEGGGSLGGSVALATVTEAGEKAMRSGAKADAFCACSDYHQEQVCTTGGT